MEIQSVVTFNRGDLPADHAFHRLVFLQEDSPPTPTSWFGPDAPGPLPECRHPWAATEIGGGSSLGVVQQAWRATDSSAAWYQSSPMGLAFIILTLLAPKFRAPRFEDRAEYSAALRQERRHRHRCHHAAAPVGVTARPVHRLLRDPLPMLASATRPPSSLLCWWFTPIPHGRLWSVTLTDLSGVPDRHRHDHRRALRPEPGGGWNSVVANGSP